MGNRTTWRWAVTFSALVLTTACGGQAEPEASSSRPAPTAGTMTTAPSPATSSAPAIDPHIPTAARAHTPAGAEAFVRYFFTQVNQAWTEPSAGLITPLCEPTSKSCSALEATAVRLKSEGKKYAGDPVTTDSADALAQIYDKQPVLFLGTQEQRNIVDSSNRTVSTDSRKQLRYEMTLVWTAEHWSIASIKAMR